LGIGSITAELAEYLPKQPLSLTVLMAKHDKKFSTTHQTSPQSLLVSGIVIEQ
jgi:hypothetical protein